VQYDHSTHQALSAAQGNRQHVGFEQVGDAFSPIVALANLASRMRPAAAFINVVAQ